MDAHAQVQLQRGVKPGSTRGPYKKNRETAAAPGAPPSPVPNYLPPGTSLVEVMGSATGLFYSIHAALLDDEGWLVSDTVKKEMGNVLSWMLADDFYKMGGIGKYVAGSVMFLGVYAIQATKTAGRRRERRAAALAAAKNRSLSQQRPSEALAPVTGALKDGVNREEKVQGPTPGWVADAAPKPSTLPS